MLLKSWVGADEMLGGEENSVSVCLYDHCSDAAVFDDVHLYVV